MMNCLIPNELGTWIECCNPDCKKWRYTLDFDDPLLVPKNWYCYMNSDQSINSCSIPESLKLEEGEIFVESKFKAGSIVWAKVIGYPWSPAMVDFCPEWECYYWFDKANTNIPSQYHVTFLSGKQITRAWLKTTLIKSFADNKDPSFALKLRVCGKKVTAHQKADVINGCRIANAALLLSVSQRLKKYNYNSWRLAQRFQNLSAGCDKTPPASSDNQCSREGSEDVAGPSKTRRSTVLKNTKTKELVKKNQSNNSPHQLEKPEPLNTQKATRAQETESSRKSTNKKKSPRKEESAIDDRKALAETTGKNTERTNRREDLDDTRSINSVSPKGFSEIPRPAERPGSVRKQVVQLRLDDSLDADVLVNGKSSSEEINDMTIDALDEIIPNSQESTPSIRSFNRTSRECSEAYSINKENLQPGKNSSAFIGSEEIEAALLNSKNFDYKRVLLNVRSTNKEKSRGFDATSPKSMSESFITNNGKENRSEESRYRRALSEFKSREQNSLSAMASYQREKVSIRKPPPNWFTDPDERRKIAANRMDSLYKLSEEEDKRMYQENRASFISEMESAAAGPSKGDNRPNSKQIQKYSIKTQNMYDYLLSSDEDSF